MATATAVLLVTARGEADILPPDHGLEGVTLVDPAAASARVRDLRSRRVATVVVLDGAIVPQPSLLADFAVRYPDVPIVLATSGNGQGGSAIARAIRRPARTSGLADAIRRALQSAAQQTRVRTTLDHLNVQLRWNTGDAGQQQRTLLLSGFFLQSIVEQARDAIFVADRGGVIALWNRGAERIFGIAAGDAVGRTLETVVPSEEGRRMHALIVSLSPEVPAREEEIAWPAATGVREVAVSLSLVRDADGSGIAVSAIGRDVTERNAMHRQLEGTAEALAVSNQHKDEFLAVLSHELRTPLNTVMGWTQILETTPHNPDRVRRAAAMIRRNNEVQLHLVLDLLDYARISAGRFDLQLEEGDVAAVAASAVAGLRPQLDARRMQLVEHYGTGAKANIDRARIGQVLTNLLGNAIKFTPPGGRIDVTVRRSNDGIHLEVADTGRGIAPDFLPHVFEAFRQAESSLNRSEHGLGLGLAISRRIIELHNGHISVRSDGEGRGASFTVTLPPAA